MSIRFVRLLYKKRKKQKPKIPTLSQAKEGWGFDRDTQLTVIYLSRTLTILYGKGWEAGNLTSVAAGDLRLYGGTGVGDLNNSVRNDGQAKTFQVILPVYC